MKKRFPSWPQRNGLSIVLLALLVLFLVGQVITGWHVHNAQRAENGLMPLTCWHYLGSAHFRAATFENWESEFLQMAMYVLLTVKLRQLGSSESKGFDGPEPVDREPQPHRNAPWPVHRGGWVLSLYRNSLSIAFALLFLLSFALHFQGSYVDHMEERIAKKQPLESAWNFMTGSDFWFESFQNWQSEFLAVASIVLLSIWLRQQGSPESKPVDAPYAETGS
ncbi:MAG: DUF6766 family protein [Flavobacteriales bacterium]